MKKRLAIRIVIVIVVLIVVSLIFLYNENLLNIKENQIRDKIEKAKYCDTADDCVIIGSSCPFGCYITINKKEVDDINKLIDSFDSNCIYGCIQCVHTPRCENNRCISSCG